jgi:DNA (cytosine-5)-methyltransferase 1
VSRPRLLDLFCGAGGAAAGYAAAGFEVVGVDIRPMPRFPYEFHEADALTYPLAGFDVIHASPPCQRYSKSVSRRARATRPDLIAPIRDRLRASGRLYVIENVPGAPLLDPVTLCGSSFGLGVRRHRRFESCALIFGQPCRHDAYEPQYAPAWNRSTPLRFRPISGGWTADSDHELDAAAMGITHPMSPRELSESIPPAYTEWIGRQLIGRL